MADRLKTTITTPHGPRRCSRSPSNVKAAHSTDRTVRWHPIPGRTRSPDRPCTRPGHRPTQGAGHPASGRTLRRTVPADGRHGNTTTSGRARRPATSPGHPQPAWNQLITAQEAQENPHRASLRRLSMQPFMAGDQPRQPRSSHWRAGCSESEPVRFGRGSSGRGGQPRWHHARRPNLPRWWASSTTAAASTNPRVHRCASTCTTSRTRSWARRSRTASTTSPRTPAGCRSAPTTTPQRSPWKPCAAGGTPWAGTATRTPTGC